MNGSSARPTLKNVSDLAGVSESSVSRVMRDAPNVSAKLRAKVEAASAQLGYIPNRVAGALASQFSCLIAVVVPSMSNSVFPDVVDGIDSVLTGTRYRAVLGITHYDLEREEQIVRDLLAWNPAGVIVSGLEHTPTTRGMLQSCPARVVEIMDVDGEPIDCCIGVSHAEAGRIMARHLVERNYTRIGYVGAWGERPSRSAKRRVAFEDELNRLGASLHVRRIEGEDSSVVLGGKACAAILTSHPDVQAIFFTNDDLAVGGLLHCLTSGISIPDRLAIAGFNGIPLMSAMPLPITTIATPRFEMGAKAANVLLKELAEGTPPPETSIHMPVQLVQGLTT